jgi:hypothetical protein
MRVLSMLLMLRAPLSLRPARRAVRVLGRRRNIGLGFVRGLIRGRFGTCGRFGHSNQSLNGRAFFLARHANAAIFGRDGSAAIQFRLGNAACADIAVMEN